MFPSHFLHVFPKKLSQLHRIQTPKRCKSDSIEKLPNKSLFVGTWPGSQANVKLAHHLFKFSNSHLYYYDDKESTIYIIIICLVRLITFP